jgi:hypothetical protein
VSGRLACAGCTRTGPRTEVSLGTGVVGLIADVLALAASAGLVASEPAAPPSDRVRSASALLITFIVLVYSWFTISRVMLTHSQMLDPGKYSPSARGGTR